jgi:hypothetical protein
MNRKTVMDQARALIALETSRRKIGAVWINLFDKNPVPDEFNGIILNVRVRESSDKQQSEGSSRGETSSKVAANEIQLI